jgi:hypothetical protein
VLDRAPAGVDGLMTKVGTTQLVSLVLAAQLSPG